MIEMKCEECGAVLEAGMTVCPQCGCPVKQDDTQSDLKPVKERNTRKTWKINVMALVSLFIGCLIIYMGNNVIRTEADISEFRASSYNAEYASFGGDFYTYIYKASDIMVDELNDVNLGLGAVTRSIGEAVNEIYYPTGMIIISIGLAVCGISLLHLRRE